MIGPGRSPVKEIEPAEPAFQRRLGIGRTPTPGTDRRRAAPALGGRRHGALQSREADANG